MRVVYRHANESSFDGYNTNIYIIYKNGQYTSIGYLYFDIYICMLLSMLMKCNKCIIIVSSYTLKYRYLCLYIFIVKYIMYLILSSAIS